MTAAEPPAVGFIGLGQMGQPMAARLTAWPGGLVVHDVRPAAMTPLAEAGATAAGSVAEVAERAGIISVMVRDDDQVRAVVPQAAEAAKAAGGPAIIAIHSTIGPGTAADLAARYGTADIEIVDAPVSGGFMGAQDGRLAVMMGSSRAAYERCRGPFGCFADLVLHLGPAGAGTQAKLARNLLHFVAFSAAAEAQRLAEAAGLDLRKLAGVVRHSDAVTGGPGSIMLRRTTAPVAPDDPLRPILEHVRALGEKDLSLALDLGTQLGVDLPLAEYARRHFAAGLGLPPGEDPGEDPGADSGAGSGAGSGEPAAGEPGDAAESTPRARGLAMMSEVYGWDVQDGPGDWFGITVEHLFGGIWTRPGLTMRDRRLLLLGLLVGQGQQDVADIQIGAALRRGELSPDALREIAIFLTHYVGWPGGARLSMQVEQLITQQAKE